MSTFQEELKRPFKSVSFFIITGFFQFSTGEHISSVFNFLKLWNDVKWKPGSMMDFWKINFNVFMDEIFSPVETFSLLNTGITLEKERNNSYQTVSTVLIKRVLNWKQPAAVSTPSLNWNDKSFFGGILNNTLALIILISLWLTEVNFQVFKDSYIKFEF